MMHPWKWIGACLCVALFACVATASAKDRVAIMDFENKSQYGGWRLGQGASDMLATELVKTGKFSVMERDRLSAILKEQDLGASGRIDPSTAARIGKIIGVEYIITGAVTEYGQSEAGARGRGFGFKKTGYHATVDIRMVSATTSEIVFADSASHSEAGYGVQAFGFGGGEKFDEKKATEVMREAIRKLAAQITSTPLRAGGAGKQPVVEAGPALVADVAGTSVILNKGRGAGFEVGQEVTLYRPGRTIKDPETGKVLKVMYEKVGVVRVTAVESSYTEGEIISGSGVQVGDQTR